MSARPHTTSSLLHKRAEPKKKKMTNRAKKNLWWQKFILKNENKNEENINYNLYGHDNLPSPAPGRSR
jgi:hypothetical protein